MKKYLLAAVSVTALAAAQPAHAGPAQPMPFSWGGWYAGGNVGYSFGNEDSYFSDPGINNFGITNLPSSFNGHQRLDGIIGGGQVGYNWQPNPYAVFGLEADFQGANEKNSASYSVACEGNTVVTTCPINQSASIKWFGTVRGRVGWLFTPTFMPYITAGLAYGDVNGSGNFSMPAAGQCTVAPCSVSWSKSQVNVGFTGGFGIEATFPGSTNWTWKAEYLYVNLGSVGGNGIVGGTTLTPYSWSNGFTDNIVRVGINYYFH